MKRRNTLKCLLAASVFAAIPFTKAQKSDFDPSKEISGKWITRDGHISKLWKQKVTDELCVDAANRMPVGTEFGIHIGNGIRQEKRGPDEYVYSDVTVAGWDYPYQKNRHSGRFVVTRNISKKAFECG